jgi:hypothetical protein
LQESDPSPSDYRVEGFASLGDCQKANGISGD